MAVKRDGSKDKLLGRLSTLGTNRLSHKLAKIVQEQTILHLGTVYGDSVIKDLGHKRALFYVLVSTEMPSILFEASFLSNPEDERRLRTPHFQDQLATGLMKAIDHYFEIQE